MHKNLLKNEKIHPLLPKKGNLKIIKNYWSITLTAIAAKIYNDLFLKYPT